MRAARLVGALVGGWALRPTGGWRLWPRKEVAAPEEPLPEPLPLVDLSANDVVVSFDAALASCGAARFGASEALRQAADALAADGGAPLGATLVLAGEPTDEWTAEARAAYAGLDEVASRVMELGGFAAELGALRRELRVVFVGGAEGTQRDGACSNDNDNDDDGPSSPPSSQGDGSAVALALAFAPGGKLRTTMEAARGTKATFDAEGSDVVLALAAPAAVATNGRWFGVDALTAAGDAPGVIITLTYGVAAGSDLRPAAGYLPQWAGEGVVVTPRFGRVGILPADVHDVVKKSQHLGKEQREAAAPPTNNASTTHVVFSKTASSSSANAACSSVAARAAFVRARVNGDGGSARAGVALRPCDFDTFDAFLEVACESARAKDLGRGDLFDESEPFFGEPLVAAEGSSCLARDGARAFDRFGARIETLDDLVRVVLLRGDKAAGGGGGVIGAPLGGGLLPTPQGGGEHSFVDPTSAPDVWVVGSGVHFVWPTVGVGYATRHAVSGVGVTTLSMRPQVFRLGGFLTVAEAKEVVDRNRGRVRPSEVGLVGRAGDRTRTSSNAWDQASPVARTLIGRAFAVLNIDAAKALEDGLQVLHYGEAQWYKPHVDYFTKRNGGSSSSSKDEEDAFSNAVPPRTNGTNRFATVFLYLSDVEAGGETVFPLSTTHEGHDGSRLVSEHTARTPGFIRDSDAKWVCNTTSTALRFKPRVAEAVLFYSQRGDSSLEPYSLHGSCPIGEGSGGEKWAANLWVWNRPRDAINAAKARGRKALTVEFHNSDPHDAVHLFWASDTGDLIPQITIQPGKSLGMNTFPGHTFVAKIHGEVVGKYAMEPGVVDIHVKKRN